MSGSLTPKFFVGGDDILVFGAEPASSTFTRKRQVFYREVSIQPQATLPPGSVDIDDLIASFEAESPATKNAIAEGRKWVAAEFYSDKPGLAKIRLARGMSQAELARRAETSQPYIARLEQGKVDPQFSTMQKIAAALEVSVAEFAEAMSIESQR